MAPARTNPKRPTPYKDALASLSPVSTAIRKTSKPAIPVKLDLDIHCGILTNGTRCTNSLIDCKVHREGQRRAVQGRSMSFDMLLVPAWSPPTPLPGFEKKGEDMGGEGMGGAKDVSHGKGLQENVPRRKTARVKVPGENISRENAPRENTSRANTQRENVHRENAPAPVKKRGPKAWTALEREGKIYIRMR
jgi:SCA7, zinc-binding domain